MSELDPVLHQPQRLRIMAALYKNRQASFTSLRDGLALTDGNLSSHAARLAEAGYLEARRVLVDAHFELRYRITPLGSEAFRAYATQLRALLEIDVPRSAEGAAAEREAPRAATDATRTP